MYTKKRTVLAEMAQVPRDKMLDHPK